MNKPIIAVDADDTIFDENNALRLYMNQHYGFRHMPKDYDVPGPFYNYWQNIWQLSPEETAARYEEFALSPYKAKLEPLTNAIEVLQNLRHDYDLVVITSRDHRVVTMTHRVLTEHYPGVFKDVHFVPLWGGNQKATKAKICVDIGAKYLIDDSFEHCQLTAKAGVNALLFGDYGWNRDQALTPLVTRVKNWAAVKEYFDAK